jgi:hypothetical protein
MFSVLIVQGIEHGNGHLGFPHIIRGLLSPAEPVTMAKQVTLRTNRVSTMRNQQCLLTEVRWRRY